MTTALSTKTASHAPDSIENEFVSMVIGDQLFGIPVLEVRDVLGPQRITRVPLAQPEIAGSLNLRGRIVTAIDMRIRLALPPRPSDIPGMSVVIEHKGELYSLIIDKVGEVMSLSSTSFEKNPATLDTQWQGVSNGIYRLHDKLLVVLDAAHLLRIDDNAVT
jgi:purine-binding chemotaxis protein CheW